MADDEEAYEEFLLNHKTQLLTCKIPDIHWNALFKKLVNEIYDAGQYFTLVHNENKKLCPIVSCDNGIKKNNPDSIFLIDHAWTYEVEYARAQLRKVPGLAKRMALLMNLVDTEERNGDDVPENEEVWCKGETKPSKNGSRNGITSCVNSDVKLPLTEALFADENGNEFPKEELVELIFDNMWRFNQTYQIQMMNQLDGELGQGNPSSLKEQVSLWYIMDEFGSAIRHSDTPTSIVRCFYYMDLGISYSILFPAQDLSYGDIVTRDFVPGVTDPIVRVATLYPWQPECFVSKYEENVESDIDSFLFSNEKRSQERCVVEPSGVVYLPKKDTYNVYTDVAVVAKSVKEPKFRLVENPEEADLLWIAEHFKDFKSVQESGKQFINQFPFENVLTCKDLLARVADRVGKLYPEKQGRTGTNRPPWFQESFNLNLELPQFIHNFLQRKERNEDNIWIIKPWNLGRSMDTHVTRNLNHIIRLRETGPKIAFKYIHNPVLLEIENVGKVKFHFRYMAAVTSVDPLIIDTDKVFWVGCANKPFSLDEFDVYEKHFTTMNYRNNVTFKQILHSEFPEIFDKQNPGYKWSDIEAKVHQIIKELFEAATSVPPPRGICHCKMSRAYYALDFMLKWADDGSRRMQPVLLEVNFNPDCNRLYKYHPDSFHYLFTSLFLGEKTPWGSVRI